MFATEKPRLQVVSVFTELQFIGRLEKVEVRSLIFALLVKRYWSFFLSGVP